MANLEKAIEFLKAGPTPPVTQAGGTVNGAASNDSEKVKRATEFLRKSPTTTTSPQVDAPPQVDTSPLEAPTTPPAFGTSLSESVGMMQGGDQPTVGTGAMLVPGVPDVIRKAAKAGVDFADPAPDGHFLSSLALGDKNKLKAYEKALKSKFGKDVPVRIGPATGMVEYLNPDTKRFTLANPPGTFNPGSLGGPAITMGPEITAGLTAAFFTRSPALVNIASSAGAFAGEVGRLQLGRQMGVNEGVEDSEIIIEAAKVAGITLASGEITRQLAKVGKFIMDVMEGKAVPQKVLDDLDVSMEEANAIADNINKRIGLEKLKFDVAQASNDEDLLNARELYKRSQKFSKRFGAFEDEQFDALETFYKTINGPYRSRLNNPTEVGEAVQGVAQSSVQREKDKLDLSVRMKEADLATAERSITSRPFENLGQELRDVGSAEQETFREWSRTAAAALNDAAGDAAFIPNVETVKAVRNIDTGVQRALFPSAQGSQRTLIGDAIDVTADEEGALRKVFDPNAKFTFLEAWDAISALKRVERISSKGLSTDAPPVGAVKQLYQALEKDLRAGTQGSPLRNEYDTFIRRYAREKNLLDEGTVGSIMARRGGKNGRFEIADDQVFSRIFSPGSNRNATEVFNLIKNRPDQMQGMREAIGDFYKKTVMPDGRVNLQAHENFMREQGRSVAVFFSKGEMRIFAKPGQIEKALQARERVRSESVDRINKTFDSEIANLNNPGKVMNLIMDPRNPTKAKAMMELLERTPDVARAVRTQFTRDFSERIKTVTRRGERVFSPAKLDKFLNGAEGEAGFRAVAKEVMGDGYVKDLDTLNAALKIVGREGRFPNRSNTAFWKDTVKNMARAYVGLFTRPGRVITALDRIRGRAAEKVMAEAMLNPANMKALLSLKGIDMRSQKAIAIIGNLGGSALLEDFGDQPRPTGTLKQGRVK